MPDLIPSLHAKVQEWRSIYADEGELYAKGYRLAMKHAADGVEALLAALPAEQENQIQSRARSEGRYSPSVAVEAPTPAGNGGRASGREASQGAESATERPAALPAQEEDQ